MRNIRLVDGDHDIDCKIDGIGAMCGRGTFLSLLSYSSKSINSTTSLSVPFCLQALTEDLGYSLDDIIDPDLANDPETELLASQARVKCLHAMTECLPAEQSTIPWRLSLRRNGWPKLS